MDNKAKSKRLGSTANQCRVANQAATELLVVPIAPSMEKEIEQAADWRNAGPESLINHALEEIAGTGGPISCPTIHRKLLDLSAKAQKTSEAPQDHFGTAEFSDFRAKLLTWKHKVRAQCRGRKRLQNKAMEEPLTKEIQVRLDGEESARLREKSQQVGMSPQALLRQGLRQALDRQSEMKKLESWIDQWYERADCLSERHSSGRDSIFRVWEKVAEIGEEIDIVIRGFLP